MITIIIAGIIGMFVGIYRVKNSEYGDQDPIDYIGSSVIGFMVGVGCGTLVSLIIPCDTCVSVKKENIESLQDNNSIKGSFFLGTGTIEGRMKYVFYTGQDVFEMRQLDYQEAIVRYTTSKPQLITEQTKPTTFWQFGWIIKDRPKYIIEVPKGTIKNNYNLDAQ